MPLLSPAGAIHAALPLPGATLGQSVDRFFRKYSTFSGRASRSEFWWVQLFMVLMVFGSILLSALSSGIFGFVFFLFFIASIVPCLSLSVRRLHDANLNGALLALVLIPAVGPFVAFALTLLPSNPVGGRFDRLPAQGRPEGLARF